MSQQDSFVNGGSLYGLRILNELLLSGDAEIIGVYLKRQKFNAEAESIIKQHNIKLIDINREKIESVCAREGIDKVFITIAQRFAKIALDKIECEVIMVVHDIGDIIVQESGVFNRKQFLKSGNIFKRTFKKVKTFLSRRLRFLLGCLLGQNLVILLRYKNFKKAVGRQNVYLIAASRYTKSALEYYFDDIKNDVTVCWSPLKNYVYSDDIKSDAVKSYLNKKRKYFLLISCDRPHKNAYMFYEVFKKLNERLGREYDAVFVGDINVKGDNIVNFKSIPSADLEHLYKNAELFIYPTFSEGFGYPPVEAMRYGTPTVAAYATAVPEVLENAGIYFNPLYKEDLYQKTLVAICNFDKIKQICVSRYSEIIKKQEEDLLKLVNLLKQENKEK
ncbi:MAG: glycosyltransferase [Clostridiales bacterium]|nr:glycosyltransferase [Clostridiales bacterium]